MDSVAEILFQLRCRGVRLWTDDGQLHYQAPSGALSSDEIKALRALKSDITDYFLTSPSSNSIEPPLVPRLASDRVPLAFSQQCLRNLMHLERHGRRTVYTATRLSGRLTFDSLQSSVSEVVRRNESLRTRIVTSDGIPYQEIDEWFEYEVELVDLSGLSANEREFEAQRLIKRLITEPTELATGPLFVAQLLRLGNHEHVFVTAMDHLFADATSACILLRDICTMYTQSVRGMPCSLPRAPLQFADYAVWQHKARLTWTDKHSHYWRGRLATAERVRLFPSVEAVKPTHASFLSLQVRFGRHLSIELRKLSQRERTSPAICALSVYAALVSRWCDKPDFVVPFLIAGRLHPGVESIIGLFAAPLFLRVELSQNDSFLDLLRRITREYGEAHEHCDFGRIAMQLPQAEFAGNSVFNWVQIGRAHV